MQIYEHKLIFFFFLQKLNEQLRIYNRSDIWYFEICICLRLLQTFAGLHWLNVVLFFFYNKNYENSDDLFKVIFKCK